MYPHRRQFLRGLLTVAGAATASSAAAQHQHATPPPPGPSRVRQAPGAIAPRVVTPDVPLLPWKMVGGVKGLHLVAEPVKREFLPGRVVDVWGYNGSMPGPTIEVNEGDRVRILFRNGLPEPPPCTGTGSRSRSGWTACPPSASRWSRPAGTFTYEFTAPPERDVLLPLAHGRCSRCWA